METGPPAESGALVRYCRMQNIIIEEPYEFVPLPGLIRRVTVASSHSSISDLMLMTQQCGVLF